LRSEAGMTSWPLLVTYAVSTNVLPHTYCEMKPNLVEAQARSSFAFRLGNRLSLHGDNPASENQVREITVPHWKPLGAHLLHGVAPIGVPEFSESAYLKGIDGTGLKILDRDGTLGTGDQRLRPFTGRNAFRVHRGVPQVVLDDFAKGWRHPNH